LRIHIWERPESFEITRTPCGSELVREGFIPDDTSSVDVSSPSRTMRIAAPVAPRVCIPVKHLPFTTTAHPYLGATGIF
ncbi:hypothetical protein, partial [Pseudomonas savastanoi]|uniref:hypothetical protein n=1 Tax=Pseudomonas savastanoi TaxID=29438 RepID=UPI001F1A5E2D